MSMGVINVTRSSMPDFEDYCNEIRKMWDTHWLTNMGVEHQEFQRKLEEYLNCPHVVLYTNGHLALENVIAAMQLPRGGGNYNSIYVCFNHSCNQSEWPYSCILRCEPKRLYDRC